MSCEHGVSHWHFYDSKVSLVLTWRCCVMCRRLLLASDEGNPE